MYCGQETQLPHNDFTLTIIGFSAHFTGSVLSLKLYVFILNLVHMFHRD